MALVGLLEDNTRIAHMCATMLTFAGHKVTVYNQAKECLQALLPENAADDLKLSEQPFQSSALPVDVLILDIFLPDQNGLEVVQHLQAHPRTSSLPLILCTASTSPDITRARTQLSHVGFIEKPYNIETLTQAISEALGTPS